MLKNWQSRHTEKISLINGVDHFLIASSGIEKQLLSPIEATDLVLQTSFVSAKQFKAHNGGLQSVCKWLGKTYVCLKY